MRVLLVNPPPPKGALSEELQAPHIGLAYLAAVLEREGHKVWVIDSHPLGLESLKLLPLIAKSINPDVVGLTSTTFTINQAYEAAKAVKAALPDVKVLMGGPHVTFMDAEALSTGYVDAVIRGEGEETLLEVLSRIEEGRGLEGVKGVSYVSQRGAIKREPARPLIEDLDSLPYPSYDHLPLEAYRSFGLKPTLPILTSRGCPFRCKFCVSWKIYQGRYRQRSPKNVVDEIEHHVERYRVTDFSFVDDLFTLSKKRVKEICREIRSRGLEISWGCSARVDTIDAELLREMRKAGCHTVYFGVESGSQRVLDSMGKGFSSSKTEEAFKLCKRLGLSTVASVILFWPDETREEVKETLRFVRRLDADLAQFCIATPFPGTDLFENLKARGMLKVLDWSKYDIVTPVFETPQFSISYMSRLWKQAYLTFYLRPSYIAKQLAKRSLPLLRAMVHMLKRALLWRLGLKELALRRLKGALPKVLLKTFYSGRRGPCPASSLEGHPAYRKVLTSSRGELEA
ncbi:MAG: B12-binding domain-containing radical SAM protein [Thermoprotei archaeon]|nr:MAG: B12-binding domain-containing radical SAM protein [Thermoprotei archaeon]